jgi:hypothetical protein
MDHKKGSLNKLEISPLDIRISVDKDFVRFVKDRLLKWRKPVALEDVFTVKLIGHKVPFMITKAHPSEGVIDKYTEFTIRSSPPERERW